MNAVQELQVKLGLNPDGVIGKDTLNAFMSKHSLSKEQTANFFGQCSHETGGFKVFIENLNYSTDGLLNIFNKYFKTKEEANLYARNPEKIANKVYANRMGNGDEKSGDGWKHRGRGALQLTGKSNYIEFSKFVNDESILQNPDLVATKYAFESAMFYFKRTNLWIKCLKIDENAIKSITKVVNGGFNGLEDRILKTNKFYNLIK